ncbi:MAG: flagellar motor protein MotP [Candidatus Glassbacteria bacterium RIFCSPLOWO2_12_FULL_58_11]|uniref:Flagellar motor protein MotP n=1 Tax=Candidatus Glassbacteria bacterium RIFCSPLOWO2_12_FULL_58_11 TaxID=1817867 RepID=A0A1F5YZC1_9BACT|nr:MAG: flagellar motor protein MotP [Candidatus Glassbacteria bacterium RIFCSPLOWO2_12_FULL_58_11]
MDLTTLIGLIAGFSIVVLGIEQTGSIVTFIDLPSVFVTVGGSLAATIICFPLNELVGVIGVAKKTVFTKAPPVSETIATLVSFAERARREGILALERHMEEIEDEFLAKGIQLAVDGTEPELMRNILTTELDYVEKRHASGQLVFNTLGALAPAFGMIGTLIGLVLMLKTMSDPSTIGPNMAVALITTFYGALMANLICIPLEKKLKRRSEEELLVKEMMIEGILSIQSGDNPRIVEQKLTSFVSPKLRRVIVEK